MIGFFEVANGLSELLPVMFTIIVILVIYLAFSVLMRIVKKSLLRVAKTKKQISNVEIFSRTIKYIFIFFLMLTAIFYYSGSWTGLGLTLGLFSAAIGFALQKPISGVAAWIMIVTRRPFEIGDRIIIGEVKGDVKDISLTHIALKEIGGTIQSEETSGRVILVPNSMLFDQSIINYTHQDEFILDQISFTITYESNLNKAIELSTEAAKELTKEFQETTRKEPAVRTYFQGSGIDLYVRFFVPAKRRQEFTSNLTQKVFEKVMKTKDVEFAYPHMQIIRKDK